MILSEADYKAIAKFYKSTINEVRLAEKDGSLVEFTDMDDFIDEKYRDNAHSAKRMLSEIVTEGTIGAMHHGSVAAYFMSLTGNILLEDGRVVCWW